MKFNNERANKTNKAKEAKEYFSNNPDAAVDLVVNSGLSMGRIKRVLRLSGFPPETVQEVLEEVSRRRGGV